MSNVTRFQTAKTPRQAGEVVRLRVLQGPDKGAIYVAKSVPFSIGRGDESDVFIQDLKASRKHAQLLQTDQGVWVLQDLGSVNGLVFKDKKVYQAVLQPGDHFGIGTTLFEFFPGETATSFIQAPLKDPGTSFVEKVKVEATQQIEVSPEEKAASQKKQKTMILVVVAAAAYWYYETEMVQPAKVVSAPPAVAESAAPDLSADAFRRDLAQTYDKQSPAFKAAEMFYKSGFREYREKNYLRAKTQFENSLQVFPAHDLAKRYLKQSNQEIEKQVEVYINRARKDLESGKLKSAKSGFESVQRFLYRTPDDSRFLESKEQVEKIQKRLGDAT